MEENKKNIIKDLGVTLRGLSLRDNVLCLDETQDKKFNI